MAADTLHKEEAPGMGVRAASEATSNGTGGKSVRVAALACVVVSAHLGGCNVHGPGVAGLVALDPGIDAAEFTTLEIRAFPDEEETFDPAVDGMPEIDPDFSLGVEIVEGMFPYEYYMKKHIGPSDHQRWRVVAWISPQVESELPEVGDWWGTMGFDVPECGYRSDFCFVAEGVDLVVEHPR